MYPTSSNRHQVPNACQLSYELEINISYSVDWYIDILMHFYQLISEQVCPVLAKRERQAARREHHDQELGRKNIRRAHH